MWSSMADTYSDNIKHQMILPEKTQQNPSKFYSHFLYKALIVVVFFVILPLFPSQAPEFINQSVLTRSWELLHLIFVGIAVSYGLFSRRNDETEKENNSSKFDYASYVSRFLEVSPVFDDEVESSSGNGIDENKVQTWSSQYRRNEPVVVVAQEHSVLDEQRTTGQKPLLLPVRSLKLRMPDPGVVKSEFSGTTSGSISRSNSRPTSKRFSGNSNKSRNGELGGLDHLKLEEKLMDNVVLSSPVPWQSRSGRMEMKEVDSPTLFNLPPSMDESEFDRFQSRTTSIQMTESSRSSSNTSSLKPSHSPSLTSPRKLSPSPSLSAESQAKIAEDLVRKRSFYKSSPPPAPPPPPPPLQPLVFQSFSKRPNPRPVSDGVSLEKDSSRVNSGVEMKARLQADGLAMGKSVRKIRARGAGDFVEDAMNGDSEKSPTVEKSGRKRGSNQTSFRTEKLRHESNPLMSKQAFMEFSVEEKQASGDTGTMVSDEDTESQEDDDTGGGSFIQGEGILSNGGVSLNNVEAASSSVSDGGRDVDRKADEFIAKFREQIRLQRINSLKRSSGQIKRNPARKDQDQPRVRT